MSRESAEPQPRAPTLVGFVPVLLFMLLVLIYTIIALSTGDGRWFLRSFRAQPERLVVTDRGRVLEFSAGHPDYGRLVAVLNETLPHVSRWEDIGISAGTMEHYRQGDALVLESCYAQPQRIHSHFAFGSFTCLLIPLEGNHADRRVVFGGRDGQYRAGALALRDTSALREAVREVLDRQAE